MFQKYFSYILNNLGITFNEIKMIIVNHFHKKLFTHLILIWNLYHPRHGMYDDYNDILKIFQN